MIRKAQTSLWFALLALLWTSTSMAQINGVAATIDGRFFGTYDLELVATSNSLYDDKTKAKLTLAIDGSLCGNGLYIAKPTIKAGVNDSVFWSSEDAHLEFSLKLTGNFAGFGISSYANGAAGTNYGNFGGKKAATLDLGCDDNQAFFTLASQNYPDLFPGGLFVLTQADSTAFFQYFARTDTYLTISNGAASARGGKFGSTPVALGDVKALVAKNVKTLPVPVTATPSSFDDYYVGTYSLTLQNAATFSPIANGTRMNFVITSDNRLCAGETVLDFPLLKADEDRVVWNNANGGYYYGLNLLPNSSREAAFQQGSIGLYSSSGRLLGTFTGNRTALSAECSDAKGIDPDQEKINLMFDLAEQRLPSQFPGGPLVYNQKADGAVYRFYAATGITVQVKAGLVAVKGGRYGNNFLNAGSLTSVIALLQSATMPVQLPSTLTGTYQLSFTSAGDYSPIASGTKLDVALTDEGSLCLDGALYTKPELDLKNVNLVRWKNTQTGYEIVLDTTASTGGSLSLTFNTLKGEALGVMSGNKTLLLAKCAGLVGGNVKIDAANQLFALAEQYYPATFPASALTYNQLSSGSLKRFYPVTGVLITIAGDTVQVSGGVYGNTTRTLGRIDALLKAVPVQLPSTLTGTFQLSFASTGGFSQIPTGSQLDVALTDEGSLCLDGALYGKPELDPTNINIVRWKSTQTGYEIALNTATSNGGNLSLAFNTLKGESLGVLSGKKTLLLAKCAGLVGGNFKIDAANQLFTLIEQYYPLNFPTNALTYNQLSGGNLKRVYPASGVVVTIIGDTVQVSGGTYGSATRILGNIDTLLKAMPVQLPSTLTGTYQLNFSSVGGSSPIPVGIPLDVALTEDGNVCLDGVLYNKPELDLTNLNVVRWKNTQTGYEITLNTATSSSGSLSLAFNTLKGESLGVLSGNKTLLLAKCAGLVAGSVKIDAANQLFALMEQYSSLNFPTSALNYNQLSSGSLKRIYPASGVLVTIIGDTVQVSGGTYGSAARTLGKIDTLLSQISKSELSVSGTMAYKQDSLTPINRKIELSDTVDMPTSTTQAAMTLLVQRQLGAELNGSSTFTFSILTNTPDKLEFTVKIANSTKVASSTILRDYDLRFVYLHKWTQ